MFGIFYLERQVVVLQDGWWKNKITYNMTMKI